MGRWGSEAGEAGGVGIGWDAYKRGGRGEDMARPADAGDAADEVAEKLRRDGAGRQRRAGGGKEERDAQAAGEASRAKKTAGDKMREMLAELLALYGKYAKEAE